jgi:hypothetical protein
LVLLPDAFSLKIRSHPAAFTFWGISLRQRTAVTAALCTNQNKNTTAINIAATAHNPVVTTDTK